jgi:Transcription elongation factor Elf1 like
MKLASSTRRVVVGWLVMPTSEMPNAFKCPCSTKKQVVECNVDLETGVGSLNCRLCAASYLTPSRTPPFERASKRALQRQRRGGQATSMTLGRMAKTSFDFWCFRGSGKNIACQPSGWSYRPGSNIVNRNSLQQLL